MCLSSYGFNVPVFEELAREYFTTYILYHHQTRTDKLCYCTRCGEWFGASKATDVYLSDEIFRAKHGDTVDCSCCDYPAKMIARGRLSTCTSLNETRRLVHITVENYNKVVIRGCYVTMNYDELFADSVSPCMEVDVHTKYVLTPGEVHCYVNNKQYTEDESDMREVSIREPFNGYMYNPGTYEIMNIEDLRDSFLKFHNIAEFGDMCSMSERHHSAPYVARNVSYLCYYALYPQLEWLIKEQAYEWVANLVYDGKMNKKYVDWSQRTPSKFFRMTKPQAKEFCELCFDKSILALWYESKKTLDLKEILAQARYFGRRTFLDFYHLCKEHQIDRAEAVKYIDRVHEPNRIGDTFTIWKDYIHAAARLGYDLTVHNVAFPRELITAHDNAEASAELSKLKKSKKGIKAGLTTRRKRYVYEDERFKIVLPDTVEEIVAEGRMQANCVAGYAARHLEGTTTILFLREKAHPDEAFYTIEVREGQIRQCYGYHNDTPYNLKEGQKLKYEAYLSRDREAAMRFKDEWWCWVKNGSPRDAKGKPISLPKAEAKAV